MEEIYVTPHISLANESHLSKSNFSRTLKYSPFPGNGREANFGEQLHLTTVTLISRNTLARTILQITIQVGEVQKWFFVLPLKSL